MQLPGSALFFDPALPYDCGVNLLALDTSTEACSVALLRTDGEVFHRFEVAPRQHNRLLPQMLDAVMTHADVARRELDYCAVTNGPGAFTGIRIAAAQAQGIGVALAIPLVPLSTLAVLAQTRFDRSPGNQVLVALDARMNEIYWAVYRRDQAGLAVACGPEHLSAESAVEIPSQVDCGAGHGWLEGLRSASSVEVDFDLLPDARSMLALARRQVEEAAVVPAEQIEMNYLRNRVAEKSATA